MNGAQLAKLTGMSPSSIHYWKCNMIAENVASVDQFNKIEYSDKAVEWLNNRPKRQGQGGNIKKIQTINDALIKAGFTPKEIYYTTKRDKKNHPVKGWYYVNENGFILFLGSNLKQAIENMSYSSNIKTLFAK